jgi:hypothetical protein
MVATQALSIGRLKVFGLATKLSTDLSTGFSTGQKQGTSRGGKMLTRVARRIAVNIAKLPELLGAHIKAARPGFRHSLKQVTTIVRNRRSLRTRGDD